MRKIVGKSVKNTSPTMLWAALQAPAGIGLQSVFWRSAHVYAQWDENRRADAYGAGSRFRGPRADSRRMTARSFLRSPSVFSATSSSSTTGLALQSLYSHMSEIQTNVGATVKKGDIIGLTGTTGLAGGDHLHFGILMHGIQVQPLDWLDPSGSKTPLPIGLMPPGPNVKAD